MALWGCAGCRTCYRARLFRCPRCHGTSFEEESMPKISRAGGASHAAAEREQEVTVRSTDAESQDVPAAVDEIGPLAEEEAEEVERIAAAREGEVQRVVVLGEEESSPGSSSETSPPRPPSLPVTSETAPPRRAPKTGSRSRKGRTGSSTAGSTATSTEGEATGA